MITDKDTWEAMKEENYKRIFEQVIKNGKQQTLKESLDSFDQIRINAERELERRYKDGNDKRMENCS